MDGWRKKYSKISILIYSLVLKIFKYLVSKHIREHGLFNYNIPESGTKIDYRILPLHTKPSFIKGKRVKTLEK